MELHDRYLCIIIQTETECADKISGEATLSSYMKRWGCAAAELSLCRSCFRSILQGEGFTWTWTASTSHST